MKKKEKSSILKGFLEILQDAIIIIGIVVLVRYFLFSPFQVSGSSMKDTMHNGDYIFVEKISYKFSEPNFGDTIIFTPPVPRVHHLKGLRCVIEHFNELSLDSKVCEYGNKYIKRVIGIPGDVISFKDGGVYRNGELLDESAYLNETNNGKTYLPAFQKIKEFKVPENHVFVLGDNRNGSSDSRYWKTAEGESKPFVEYSKIDGKFFLKLFAPSYFFGEKEEPFLILK
ncbi:signal peptidase I [Candidatus Gracilibacteria bacterium]|nr:signal peptidase I [Candidatus Gracilibacteria bacterium]